MKIATAEFKCYYIFFDAHERRTVSKRLLTKMT